MASAAEYRMPGAYHFDGPSPPAQVFGASIFRPPLSPSASSYNLAKSTGSLQSDISMLSAPALAPGAKRKRNHTRESTPVDWERKTESMAEAYREDPASARQMRYTLAGQIATPGSRAIDVDPFSEDSIHSDVDYRRALGSRKYHEEPESPAWRVTTLHYPPPAAPPPSGWSMYALSTLGGMVGKVWEFCKAVPFRGFQAGGGEGYGVAAEQVTSGVEPEAEREWAERPSPERVLPERVPALQQGIYNTPEALSRPAMKRRQVSENDDLRRNWVMVEEGEQPASTPSRPIMIPSRAQPQVASRRNASGTLSTSRRKINVPISRLSNGASQTPRRGSRGISHAGSPSLSAREPASFAQPRSPVILETPSRIPLPAQGSGRRPSSAAAMTSSWAPSPLASKPVSPSTPAAPSSGGGHRRSHSSASTASGHRRSGLGVAGRLDADDIQASARLSAEAKALAQRKLAAERHTEGRVDAFNARLLEMIQQGKEALGTTVEVLEDDDGGGGWEDEE